MAHRQRLLHLIDEYGSRHPDEAEVVAGFLRFVRANERCFERDCWSGHITGSAWLVNGAGTHVLLTHHRKLGAWLQLGGHSDGDSDTLGVARREAEEESGLPVSLLQPMVFDLDVHQIPARGREPAHPHYDVRFLFRAAHERFAVSGESLALAWVPVAELSNYPVDASILRMSRKWVSRRDVTKSNKP